MIYSLAFGFCSGTILSGASAALSVCAKEPRDIGTYMGMGMAVGSVAVLIGPPVNGALVDRYGGYKEVALFSVVVCLVGGLAAGVSKFTTKQGVWEKI